MQNRTRFVPMAIISTFLFALLLSTTTAQALTASFGGDGDPSLHGTTGALTISGPIEAGTGTFDVTWSMDFDGYEGAVGDHQYLTQIAFKAFTDITAVSLDSITWDPATTANVLYPSNVNNAGCIDGSAAGMVCATLDGPVDATMGGEILARFSVTGDLKLSEWSYRGKFGPEKGWVISESSAPVPEPSAALVFGAGLATVGWRLRRSSR